MMLPKLSDNRDLPVLNGFAARSTWLVVLATAIQICNLWGIDLLGLLGAMGLGDTPEDVAETGERIVTAWQMIAPIALSIWAWIERRAPNFRLVWPWAASSAAALAVAGLLGTILAVLTVAPALAQGQRCGPREELLMEHFVRYAETPAAAGLAGPILVELLLSPARSFTVLFTRPDGVSCVIASGYDWEASPALPPGEPS